MLDVKNNFRNKYQNNECRGCGETTETQEHVLEECKVLQMSEETKVRKEELFTNNPPYLKSIAHKIGKTMEKLENIENTAPQ